MLAPALPDRLLRKPVIMSQTTTTETPPIVIKKYANRRLYNTATSSYVTLDDLSTMVKEGGDFVVYDAKTGEDITRAVLTQIIVEEEQKGHNLLPISFLRQLIGFYGDSMQWLVPRYLEHTMKSFSHNQEQMRKSLQDAFGGLFPFGGLEEMGKQNMALFEKTMKMFSPFPAAGERGDKPKDQAPADDANLRELTDRLNTLQKQIDALHRKLTQPRHQVDRGEDDQGDRKNPAKLWQGIVVAPRDRPAAECRDRQTR
jgi:polyhydroxyalkanoate synthesis repressor PhaR